MHADFLIPQWPAPAHVKALFTTRLGGVSAPPFDSFNLGDHVGDAPSAVAQNRARLQQAVPARLVFLSQVHGTQVLPLQSSSAQGTVADACMTREPGQACTIMVADCLPVLFTDTAGAFVAAAHAGWRGLAGGVLEEILRQIRPLALMGQAQSATEIIAWLGPCIGPQAFEVGPEVRAAFVQQDPQAAACFRPAAQAGKWLADLAGLARLRLQAQGVTQVFGNDSTAAWCTVQQTSRFFSHRRDGVSGRMAACIWLDGV